MQTPPLRSNEKSAKDILDYVTFVIFKRKWTLLFVFVTTIFLFAFATYLITPQWEGMTKLIVLASPNQQPIVFEGIEYPSRSTEVSSIDMVEILNSNEFAGRIVEKWNLAELNRKKAQEPKDFREKTKMMIVDIAKSPLTLAIKLGLLPYEPKDFFADSVEELIEDWEDIELIEETKTVQLSVWADTPEMATGIANDLAAMLVERVKEFNKADANVAFEFIKSHLETVKKSLEAEEQHLLELKQKSGIADLNAQKPLLIQRWESTKAELAANTRNLAAVNSKLDELQRQLAPPIIVASAEKPAADEYARLRNSMKESDIEKSIIDTHTAMSELKSMNASLQSDFDKLQKELDTIPSTELEIDRAARSVASMKDRYVTMNQKFLELEVQKFTETPKIDVKTSSPAYIAPGADYDWPDWVIASLVIIFAACTFAPGTVFFMEYWSSAFDRPKSVRDLTDIKVLGSVRPISMNGIGRRLK